MGEYSSMIFLVENAMLNQLFLKVSADLLMKNVFSCFSQFIERRFHWGSAITSITEDQPSLGIP